MKNYFKNCLIFRESRLSLTNIENKLIIQGLLRLLRERKGESKRMRERERERERERASLLVKPSESVQR